MAVEKMRYQDLNHALKKFRAQVSESIPYALENLPTLNSPKNIFDYLKQRVTYKNDPKGIELFQTLSTLLNDNFHGITGAGDCDCFTIACLAVLLANGFHNCGIVLAGRNAFVPVHIWAYVDIDGKRENLDLTNKQFNQTRFYPYLQHIPYKLNQTEKNMLLQLAEDGTLSRRGAPRRASAPSPRKVNRQAAREVRRQAPPMVVRQQQMQPVRQQQARAVIQQPVVMPEQEMPENPYIYLPSEEVQVRQDVFDDLSPGEFQNMLIDEGYSLSEICELSKDRAKRRFTLRPGKAVKQAAKASKPRNIKAKSKADARKVKAQAKLTKAKNADGSKFNKLLDTAKTVSNTIFGKDKGGNGSEDTDTKAAKKTKPDESNFSLENLFNGDVFGIPKPVARIGGAALLYGGYKLATK